MKQINEVTGKEMQLGMLSELYSCYLYAEIDEIYTAKQRERLVASNFSEDVIDELCNEREDDEVLEAVVTAFFVANYRKVPEWQAAVVLDENEIVSCFATMANEWLAKSDWAKSLDMFVERLRLGGKELPIAIQYVAEKQYVKVLAMSLVEFIPIAGSELLVALGF